MLSNDVMEKLIQKISELTETVEILECKIKHLKGQLMTKISEVQTKVVTIADENITWAEIVKDPRKMLKEVGRITISEQQQQSKRDKTQSFMERRNPMKTPKRQ